MKKFTFFLVLLIAVMSYAQDKVLDKIELKSEKIYLGKVEKIKTDIVEFRESETDLIYEIAKKDIRYIQLASGKILTFEDVLKAEQKTDYQNTWEKPAGVEKEGGSDVGLIILATVGVVLLVLILIGAAAGS